MSLRKRCAWSGPLLCRILPEPGHGSRRGVALRNGFCPCLACPLLISMSAEDGIREARLAQLSSMEVTGAHRQGAVCQG